MRNRWLRLAVIGVATTFTVGASAGFLRPAADESPLGAGTAPAVGPAAPSTTLPGAAPLPASPGAAAAPAPATVKTTGLADQTMFVTDVGNRPGPQLPKPLDSFDPWSETPRNLAGPATRRGKPRVRPLDSSDPWATDGREGASTAAPASPLSSPPSPPSPPAGSARSPEL